MTGNGSIKLSLTNILGALVAAGFIGATGWTVKALDDAAAERADIRRTQATISLTQNNLSEWLKDHETRLRFIEAARRQGLLETGPLDGG